MLFISALVAPLCLVNIYCVTELIIARFDLLRVQSNTYEHGFYMLGFKHVVSPVDPYHSALI